LKNKGIPVYEQEHAIKGIRKFRYYIDQNKFNELKRFCVKTGDIIISCSGTVGEVSVIKEEDPKGIISQALLILRADKNVAYQPFLKYFLMSPYGKSSITSRSDGSVQVNIAKRQVIENIDILLPPLTEQKAIAEVLSSLDDKIDLLIRQNKTLEDLAQAYFRKWFIEDIHNKICYKRFADVAEFSKGKKPREIIEEQRKGYVRQILIDTFDTDKEYYTRPEGMIISTETDILMVMDGASSGRVEIGFSGVVGSTIGMFRPKSDFKYPMFLYEFLKSNEEFIMDNTTGSAIPHADKKLIFELEIPYFQEEKIQEFENFALVLFNKRQNNRRQIRTLTKLRDTLLPKLISGEIRVKM
jgi:type I restriction enzyme S subunit